MRVLVVAASLVLALAVLAGYAERAFVDSDQFANRATAALEDDSVRGLIATKITDEVVLANQADLLAVRPIIESAASSIVGGRAFTRLFRAAVRDVHAALFLREQSTLTLTVADVGTVLVAALENLRPELADDINASRKVEIVERHVEDARAKGARVLVGGTRGKQRSGYWFEPTVLADVDHTMLCMREETFGPTLPIMKVADAEEAIRLANDSPYGLAASVFSKDTRKAEAIARRIQAGAVCVNDAIINYAALELPMGGAKASGLGTRHGAGGIRKYCQQQAVLVTRFAPKKDPQMYPYSSWMTKVLSGFFRFLYGRGKRD